jgi:hypothetical protein
VRFSFEGITPPNMTPEVLAHIWDQAERQGFKPHCLRSYANILAVQPAPILRPKEQEPKPVLEPRPWDQDPNRQALSRGLRRPAEKHVKPAA